MARILIVTDVRLFREGLAEVLSKGADHTVASTASLAVEALERVHDTQPEVALVDARMAESLACVRAITRLSSGTRVVALGVAEGESDMLAWAEAGVSGFVPLEASLEDLVAAITHAHRGELACSARVAGALLRHVGTLAQASPRAVPALTAREFEVLRLLDRHLSNKEIARQLGIEVATVKNHVHRLLEKLQVHRRLDAVTRVKERLAR